MRTNIFKKKYCIMIGIILLSCMIIGSFFDYQLSTAIYHPESLFGILFASYGQLPAMLCFASGGTLLIKMADKEKKGKMSLCYIFAVLLNLLAIAGITLDPMLYIENMSVVLSVMIAVVIVVVTDMLVYTLTKGVVKTEIKKFIILVLGVMLVEMIFVNLVKIPWGRPRMRLIANRGDVVFQPWWVIGSELKDALMTLGVAGEEFKSFPSGHTANAACAMLLGTLPLVMPKLKGKETQLFLAGVCFTFIVAISRIVMGAHFLTDVTIGMSVTFIVEMIFIRTLWKE